MIEKVAHKLSYNLYVNGIVEQDKLELLEYGIFRVLTSALHILLLLTVGLLFSLVIEIAAFMFGFILLKRYIGGAHANKQWVCLLLFTAIAWGGAWLGKTCSALPVLSALPPLLSLSALVLIIWKAPVIHPNSPRRKKEILLKFRRKAIAIASVLLACVCISYMPLWHRLLNPYIFCGSLGSFTAAFALLLPVPEDKTGKGGAGNEE